MSGNGKKYYDAVSVRGAALSDLEAAYEIDGRLFPPDVAFDPETFLFCMLDEAAAFLVADLGGEIAGFAIVRRISPKTANIFTIDVREDLQGLGIGSRLMDACHAAAAQMGASRIVLEVDVDNGRAIGFYERRGYTKRKILKNYYRDGSNAWEMARLVQ